MVNKNNKKLKPKADVPKTEVLVQPQFKFLFGFPLLFFLLFSCASSPSVPKPEAFYKGRSGFSLMEEGAALYLTADVQSVRPILDALVLGGMTGSEIKNFLDMSDVLIAAVFMVPGKRHFYAAASGAFPSARGGLFFSASKDWEKKISETGMPYWYSSRSQLSVSLNAKAAYLSDADPFVPLPGASIPEALPALQKNAVLSGWMNNPSQTVNKIIADFEVPIEIPADRLVFAVYPVIEENADGKKAAGKGKAASDSQYTAALRFETPTSTQAAGLVMIFAMAKLGIARADFSDRKEMETLAKAFFSQNPRQDGNALVLDTGIMNGKDLALLFNSISIY